MNLWKRVSRLERMIGAEMTTVEEVAADIATLKTDLEADALKAHDEFVKLEAEIAAGGKAPDLTPLKASIDALDTKAKAVVVPTA